MRLIPATLFGRLLLAVSLPLVIAFVLTMLLVMRDRQALSRRLAGTTADVQQVASNVIRLSALDESARAAAIAALDRRPAEWRLAGRMPPANVDDPARVRSIAERTFASPLRSLLGAGYRVEVQAARRQPREPLIDWGIPNNGPPTEGPGAGGGPDRGLYDIDIVAPDGVTLYFRLRGPPRDAPLATGLLWQLVALGLVLAVVLFVVTRRLTKPLSRLQSAAERIGRSAARQLVPETGAREVRDTIRAFNTMQERLHRYLDSRSRVLAAMSHDLRTPLTRLRLRAESIDEETTRKKMISDISDMDALITSALRLFKGLDEQEATSAVDIDALLAGLVAEYRDMGHEIALQGSVGRLVPAQPVGLKRALVNLIDNALAYGREARIEVQSAATLRIDVCDRGPGIPEAELESVFEPFHRLEGSRNRALGGIGLGLCSARDAIEKQGGSLRLSNLTDPPGLQARIEIP